MDADAYADMSAAELSRYLTFTSFITLKIAITHFWHSREPQTMCHLMAKDKVAEQHI